MGARAWLGRDSDARKSPTRGRGKWTTFGSVALLGWNRRDHATAGVPAHHGGRQAKGAPANPHGVWTETVLVGVEVHNGLDRPLLFSPGQFRLRVGDHGPTVTAYDAERPPGGLPARSTLTTWVRFLAPPDASDLSVEFTDPDAAGVLSMRLGQGALTGVAS